VIRIALVAAVASLVVAGLGLTVELSSPRPAGTGLRLAAPDFPRPSSANGCTPDGVQRSALPAAARDAGIPPAMPWVSDGRGDITGSLAYLGDPPLRGSRVAVIGTRGHAAGGAVTRILWWVRAGAARTLVIAGHRTDSPGSFHQTVAGPDAAGSSPVFPAVVDVPAAGCWTLDVRSGTATASLRFQAIDLRG
jgi:hypothetical protein